MRMNKKDKVALVPKLRFPEFKNDDAWKKVNIGKYLKESRIKGSKGDTAKKLTVKLWGQGVFEKKETLKGSENTQYFRRKSGQFIYSKLDFLNQAFGIVPNHLDGYESTVDLPCFDVSENINVRFLLEYVQRTNFYKKYGEMADGGRKAKRIQVDTFLEFPIYMPNFKEQQKIASCLSYLDCLINAEDKKLEALKAHKKGLMQKLFPAEGKTIPEWRFPDFRGSGQWTKKTLGQLGELVSGLTYSPDDIRETGLLVLRSSNIKNNVIALNDNVYVRTDISGANLSLENDILICVRNGSKALIGKNAIIPKNLPCEYRAVAGRLNLSFNSSNQRLMKNK